jgi:hypothetical protein
MIVDCRFPHRDKREAIVKKETEGNFNLTKNALKRPEKEIFSTLLVLKTDRTVRSCFFYHCGPDYTVLSPSKAALVKNKCTEIHRQEAKSNLGFSII